MRMRLLVLGSCLSLGSLLPLAALGQQDLVEASADSLEDAPGVEAERKPKNWDVRLGALGAGGPDFEGADDYELRLIPYLRINWRDRLILRGRSLEMNLYRTQGLKFGPTLRIRGGRDEDDNAALRGLGDIDGIIEAGGFLRVKQGPWRLRVTALQDVSGEYSGARVNFNAGLQVPFDAPLMLVRFDATWVSGNFMDSYFGVTAAQSLRSGLPRYDTDAGFRDVGLSIASRLPVGEHWSLIGVVGYQRLLGEARDSPLVDLRGDPNQFFATLGAAYQF